MRAKLALLVGVAATSLAACGGGGSVNSGGTVAPPTSVTPTPGPAPTPSPTPTPTPTPSPTPTPTPAPTPTPTPPPAGYVITPSANQPVRSANDTTEFRRNYGANEFVRGLYALDSGHNGKGVTVGIIDDGAINAQGELDGRIDTALSKDFGYVTSGGTRTKRNSIGDENSDHGTAIANIIAGNANNVGSVGYAPGAKLAILRVSDWNADTKTETLSHVVTALKHAGDQGIKLLNISLTSGTGAAYRDALTNYGNTGGLAVLSAGNTGEPNPNDAGAITSSNRDAVLFVVALSGDLNTYRLAGFSNQAGSMMDRTVTAPGGNVTVGVDGTVGVFQGTSSAAPVVTSLAATILSKWPQLSGQQAGDVILSTAKDIGAPGTDTVFGRGLVDFQAALSPINPTLSNGSSQTSIQNSVMAIPSGAGTTSLQTALSNITVLDAFGRDFTGSVAGLVVRPEERQIDWMRRRVGLASAGGRAEFNHLGFAASLGFASYQVTPEGARKTVATSSKMSFKLGKSTVTAAWNAQDSLQSDIMGLASFSDGVLAYAPQAGNSIGYGYQVDDGQIGFTLSSGKAYGTSAQAVSVRFANRRTDVRASFIDEDGSLMGVPTGAGALRLGNGATTAMIEAHHRFGNAVGWALEAYGSLGMTQLKIDSNSLITGSDLLIASRLGVQSSGPAFGGMLSFGVAQPLNIERGSVNITHGSGYNLASQSLLYSTSRANLAGQRRLQFTTGYATGSARSSFRIGVMQDVTNEETNVLASWSRQF